LIYLTFFGSLPEKFRNLKGESTVTVTGMGILAAAIVFIGLFPNLVLERLVNPAVAVFAFDAEFIHHHLVGLPLFTVENVLIIAVAVGLGVMVTFIGLKTGILEKSFPEWMYERYIGLQIKRLVVAGWRGVSVASQDIVDVFKDMGIWLYRVGFRLFQKVDYRPGDSQVFRIINFSNIDFDLILIMVMLGIILVLLFHLQFGMSALAFLSLLISV